MTEDDQLARLLRSALPPVVDGRPSRDLWPAIERRLDEPPGWSWFDLALAATVVIGLGLYPGWMFVLAYHL